MRDIETIRLIDVITDIRSARESRVVSMQHLTAVRAVDQVMSALEASRRSTLGEQNFRSLVEAVDEELESALIPS
jgi:hypothetical protein